MPIYIMFALTFIIPIGGTLAVFALADPKPSDCQITINSHMEQMVNSRDPLSKVRVKNNTAIISYDNKVITIDGNCDVTTEELKLK